MNLDSVRCEEARDNPSSNCSELRDHGIQKAVEVDGVYDRDRENLPVHFDKELKLLQECNMLYRICRTPYDQRAMTACDKM
ncbi:ARID DNA-binding domain-containing protein [Artemisia annua]|uniref:ARID DNA-binding domain-containing protein n=1 Tax=Artemisia annua TaxID=35608 RepID=A0A2U1NUA2_ARTAN|nr:ARID DNA-binding domain-containing protein [Artemisia annua]